MSDRELLELAAKAAGRGYGEWTKRGIVFADVDAVWNPLTDDGDALRLASKLQMQIDFGEEFIRVDCDQMNLVTEVVNWDRAEAARRAIVRAAAEIGRSM